MVAGGTVGTVRKSRKSGHYFKKAMFCSKKAIWMERVFPVIFNSNILALKKKEQLV